MKNVQVIDTAVNCAYTVYQLTDEEFDIVFPDGQDIEFSEDLAQRMGPDDPSVLFDAWDRHQNRKDVHGIHGTYYIGWRDRLKRWYPTKREAERLDVPLPDTETPLLIQAIVKHDFEAIDELLRRTVDLEQRDRDGATALMHAASEGLLDVVKILLERGANPMIQSRWGATALYWASLSGNQEVVDVIRRAGTPVMLATVALYGQDKIVEGHLKDGIALWTHIEHPSLQTVDNGPSRGPLLILRLEPNFRSSELFGHALSHAATIGNNEIVRILIDAGADLQDHEGSKPPLHCASTLGHRETVEMLLDAGADINQPDDHGSTALMQASARGQVEIVKLLLSRGADRRLTDEQGANAVEYATSKGNSEIARLISEQ